MTLPKSGRAPAELLGELLGGGPEHAGTFAQVQLSHGSSPVNIHLSTYGPSLDAVDDILATFAQAVAAAQAADPVDVPDDLSSQLATLDGESLTPEVFEGLVAATGVDLSGGRLGRLATVNHLLDAARAELRELLLERFLGALFTPRV